MNHTLYKHITCVMPLFILFVFLKGIPVGASAGDDDYSHRKRDCEITLVSPGGEPLAGTLVAINQISNHFAFGGTICSDVFNTLGEGYRDWFLSYFDYGTPATEMTWEYVMNCSDECDPDYSKADSLINWLLEKKIPVRGHNLFCNEKEDRLPEWTRDLETAAFKQAMLERIEATGHFKGKVAQWDLINEICHGEDGLLPSGGMLETKSGDPDVFSWIMDEARKKDPSAEFVINDYDLITSGDQSARDAYIDKLKPLNGKFDIIGAEGHFGASMDKNTYEPNINYLAEQLGKPVWLTDVDFSFDGDQAPDKVEELMRTCFANPNVGGISMGSWSERHMSRDDLTSYFIDSTDIETPTGKRWRDIRAEWKTTGIAGYTDENGKFSFNGFHGNYMIVISCYLDTFYLEPGEGTKTIEVIYNQETAVDYASVGLKTTEFIINGITVPVKISDGCNRQLLLTTYSLTGQQLSRFPAKRKNIVFPPASFCRIIRLETADRRPLFTGKIMAVR